MLFLFCCLRSQLAYRKERRNCIISRRLLILLFLLLIFLHHHKPKPFRDHRYDNKALTHVLLRILNALFFYSAQCRALKASGGKREEMRSCSGLVIRLIRYNLSFSFSTALLLRIIKERRHKNEATITFRYRIET